MALGQANYPASFNQESVLLGWELMIRAKRRLPLPQGPIAFETESAPSLSVLKATLRALLRRHAALRTRFQLRNGATISDLDRVLAMFGRTRLFVSGMFEQVIEDEEECSEIPLKVFPQRADLERWVDEPLDYRCSPACSAAVAYEGTKAFFALVVSHLVVDGWSVRIIQRDLIDLYAAIIGGHAPSGANHAGCHPGEFAAWQHRMVAQGGFAADEAFWLESWRAAAPAEVPLELLPCRRRDECNGDWTESVTVTVDEEASRLVRRAAARSRVTPYAIFPVFTDLSTAVER